MEERLQKIIATAGVTSRRKAEQLILEGRVTVNGRAVTQLGSKADPARDEIRVDGRPLARPGKRLYLLLNKPVGYVSTLSDPQGRPTVISLLRGIRERVYPVGRLDYHSSGLMLLTNDGELANVMMSRASAVPRTYHVKLEGDPGSEDLAKLERGIVLDGQRTAPCRIVRTGGPGRPGDGNTPGGGRDHQVRRLFESHGEGVGKVKRIQIDVLTDQCIA